MTTSQLNGSPSHFDPAEALARVKREFGEHGGVNMSIEASTTFTVMEAETMPDIFGGRLGPDGPTDIEGSVGHGGDIGGCYLYGRHFNPTVYVLGRYLAAMEDTEAAYCCASGMGAVSCAIMQLTEPGDHIVSSNNVYGGTYALMNDFLPRRTKVTTTFVDITDLDAVRAAITDRTKVVYTEAISNPTLQVADLEALAKIAHDTGATFVVDNTFSPMIITPARHGADVVIHSLTKFVSGGSDIIGGAVCASKEFVSSMMGLHEGAMMLLGPTMDPRQAFDLSLRLPHLGIRMAEHGRRAKVFAERLSGLRSELGFELNYPGLPEHEGHTLLTSLANPGYGLGGLLGIDLGTKDRAFEFMELLQNEHAFGYLAVSLGYFDTLMSCSASSTSSEVPEEAHEEAGLRPGYVRMSVGLTGSLEQRWAQLESALRAVMGSGVTV